MFASRNEIDTERVGLKTLLQWICNTKKIIKKVEKTPRNDARRYFENQELNVCECEGSQVKISTLCMQISMFFILLMQSYAKLQIIFLCSIAELLLPMLQASCARFLLSLCLESRQHLIICLYHYQSTFFQRRLSTLSTFARNIIYEHFACLNLLLLHAYPAIEEVLVAQTCYASSHPELATQ